MTFMSKLKDVASGVAKEAGHKLEEAGVELVKDVGEAVTEVVDTGARRIVDVADGAIDAAVEAVDGAIDPNSSVDGVHLPDSRLHAEHTKGLDGRASTSRSAHPEAVSMNA